MLERRLKEPFGKAGLVAVLVAFAVFWLAPAGQAFAAEGHLTVKATGTGSGEVVSLPSEELFPAPTPPITCKYDGSATSGNCVSTAGETEEESGFYSVQFAAHPEPGSKFVGWTIQKGYAFFECPNSLGVCGVGQEKGAEGGELEVTADFVGIPFHLAVFVNGAGGSGTVTSAPSGINCSAGQECSAGFAGGVTLTAHPVSGYMVAGWIGCKQTGTATCLVVPGAENEAREVTAILLKEGEKGSTGSQGGTGSQGPQGASGGVGAQGPAGANGNGGAPGAQGPAGPAGPAGPRGPEGKVTVTCKVNQSKGKKKAAKVACTVKQSASAASVHRRLRWSLRRDGRVVVGHGDSTAARLQYVLNHLRHGRYALHLVGQQGSVAIEVS